MDHGPWSNSVQFSYSLFGMESWSNLARLGLIFTLSNFVRFLVQLFHCPMFSWFNWIQFFHGSIWSNYFVLHFGLWFPGSSSVQFSHGLIFPLSNSMVKSIQFGLGWTRPQLDRKWTENGPIIRWRQVDLLEFFQWNYIVMVSDNFDFQRIDSE